MDRVLHFGDVQPKKRHACRAIVNLTLLIANTALCDLLNSISYSYCKF